MRGGGLGQPLVSLARPGLLGGQVLAHLLGCLVRRGAHLVGGGGAALGLGPLGLCGRGALLGRGPGGLDFGLGRGGVAEGGHGAGEPVGDAGQLAGQVPRLCRSISAPVTRAMVTGCSVSASLVTTPRSASARRLRSRHADTGLCAGSAQYSGGRPGFAVAASGASCAAGELARHGVGLLGHDALRGLSAVLRTSLYHFISLLNLIGNEMNVMK